MLRKLWPARGRLPGFGIVVKKWRRDDDGATAVEFAMVALPFLLMLYGIIGVGLFYFTTFSLENAIEQASRQIRTGQAQTGTPPLNAATFKASVCANVPQFVDCGSKLYVNVMNFPNSAAITPGNLPQCLDNTGALSTGSSYSPGQENVVVLAWLCYEWEMSKIIPWLNLSNMGNGSRLIQATTTFRTEPYK